MPPDDVQKRVMIDARCANDEYTGQVERRRRGVGVDGTVTIFLEEQIITLEVTTAI